MPLNRPFKRKLELALLAYLEENKSGLAFVSLPMVTGHSTTLAEEVAFESDATDKPKVEEPEVPYLAVHCQAERDPDMPGVFRFEVVLHLKTDGSDHDASRVNADTVLRDLNDLILSPPDNDAVIEDANRECGAFFDFANKPVVGLDERPAYRKNLHVYGMWPTDEPTLFDDGEDFWHDQLVYAGHAQDMDHS